LFTFESSIVPSVIILYLYEKTSFPTIRNAWKGRKPDKKSHHPYGFKNSYKKSINEENSGLIVHESIL
jgi:hypothetical protein